MIPAPLEAVVFDMDGLLLDTETLYRTALFETCAGLGFELTDDVHLSLIGSPHDETGRTLIACFGAGFPLEVFHERSRAEFDRLCADGIPLRPGARALIEFLRAEGIPTGLATSTQRAPAEVNLKRAGLFDLFDTRITRTDVTFGKPHPESYLKAAAALGADPSRCLALEDSHNGVRSAAAAGMATIMVPDMLPPTDEMRALCVGIVATLGLVQEMLERQLNSDMCLEPRRSTERPFA